MLRQDVFVRDASVQALSMQDTEFDFSHIEPTAMLGGVMDFEFGGNAAGLGRRERFIQRCEFVRIQIVHHHDDRVCLREMDIDQVAHAVGKIDHGAARRHLDMTPSLQRCEAEKEVAGAVAFILVVIFGHRTRSGRQRQTGLFGQLFAAFIKTDHRSFCILLPMIDRKRIFHGADELGARRLRYTPCIFQPRLKFVFFVRTVSREIR